MSHLHSKHLNLAVLLALLVLLQGVQAWSGQVAWLLVAALLSMAGFWHLRRLFHKLDPEFDHVCQQLAHGQLNTRMQETHNPFTAVRFNQLSENLENTLRVIGLQSSSLTACTAELVRLRTTLESDARASIQLVDMANSENTLLADEITAVKTSLAHMQQNINAVATASFQLSHTISNIADNTRDASHNIMAMAAAAEQMSANISGVKKGIERVYLSADEVASSTRQINTSVQAVRQLCQSASERSNQAHHAAQGTREGVDKLILSAREITQVVELINSIAEQTNMLALNAAIEAAGAGEAGKGFAVVANEVKELARQTASATDLIHTKVEGIQDNAQEVLTATTHIVESVGHIKQSNDEIAHAVDEQAGVLEEISQAMARVVTSAEEVNRNSHELNFAAMEVAQSAQEMSQSIADVANASAESAVAATDVSTANQQVKENADAILLSASRTEDASQHMRQRMTEVHGITGMMASSSLHFGRISRTMQKMSDALYASQLYFNMGKPAFNPRQVKEGLLRVQAQVFESLAGHRKGQPLPEPGQDELGQWLANRRGDVLIPRLAELYRQFHATARQLLAAGASDRQRLTNTLDSQLAELFQILDSHYLGSQWQTWSNRPFFPWSDTLSVGVKAFDDDHKKLVGMVNQLHAAMRDGKGSEVVTTILGELAAYTNTHFQREEKAFAQYRYPTSNEHVNEHRQMVQAVLALAEELKAGDLNVAIDVLAFAKSWLTHHILGTDMRYKAFFQGKEVR